MKRTVVAIRFFITSLYLIEPSLLALHTNQEIDFQELELKEHSFMYHAKNNYTSSIINERDYEEQFSKGNEAFNAGLIQKAIEHYIKSTQLNPNPPQPYFNLGIAYEAIGEKEKAIEVFKKAIALKSDYPKAHQQLAKLYQQTENIPDAILHYQQAIRFDPNLIDSAITVARLLVDKERFKEAVPYFEIGAKNRSNDIQLRFEYANTLNTVNETEKALEIYLELLKQRPNDSGILYNTAYTFKKLGRIAESMPYYEKTLAIKPDHSEAHFSLGLTYLTDGNFKQGWPEYQWRWNRNVQMQPRHFTQPEWDGCPLDGKTIFIHAEQGLGDTFQFIRYAQVVKEKYHGTVIVAVQKPLHAIISHCCPYIDRVITLDYIPQHFDYHIPMLSLPFVLKTEQHTIPGTDPYIFPDPTLIALWKEKLSQDTSLKVGICWQGNSNYSTPFLRATVAAKSLPFYKFAPLALPGVTLYSLQRETGVDQLNADTQQFKLVTFDESFDNEHGRFMDTAALMKNLDLIISVDTSICHLAGAIGVPVWVMIPEPPDWRWMLKRTDSPWYPHTMHLFRQEVCGDWESVIQTMAQELKALMGKKTTTAQEPALPEKTLEKNSLTQAISAEQDHITTKMKALCLALIKEKASPDDQQFMNTIHSLYLLDSMRELNNKKLSVIKG